MTQSFLNVRAQKGIQPVGAMLANPSVSFSRPASAATYAANAVISDSASAPTILEFTSAAQNTGGTGMIVGARHAKNSTVIAQFRLMLYRATRTAINDNSQFPLLWANRLNRVGWVDFTSHAIIGTGSDSTSSHGTFPSSLSYLPYACDNTSLFGVLLTTNGYSAPASEAHLIELIAHRF